eukprot:TRINITY_DN39976_c0_g1_i1.p1 TRINITY_DN39976_c0_g1~~TRINITY_DN39976_c0_g1_i1.p1  ORF type:complete len:533 (+),score=37.81 TRINITY_DN39976_c0_g1_i1:65-1600(+)
MRHSRLGVFAWQAAAWSTEDVGYRRAADCWEGGFSPAICCSSPTSQCWLGFPGGYEACCLHRRVPSGDLGLEIGRARLLHSATDLSTTVVGVAWEYVRWGAACSLDEHLLQAASSSMGASRFECFAMPHCCERQLIQGAVKATESLALLLLASAGSWLKFISELILHHDLETTPNSSTMSNIPDGAAILLLQLEEGAQRARACCEEPRYLHAGLRCCGRHAPGLGNTSEVLRIHHLRVADLLEELDRIPAADGTYTDTAATLFARHGVQTHDTLDISFNLNRLLLVSKRISEANVLLASRLAWLCRLGHQIRPEQTGNAVSGSIGFEDAHCCRYWAWVGGLTGEVFLNSGSRPVHLIELGVRHGELSHHLLSLYSWIQWTGVDVLQTFGTSYFKESNKSLILRQLKARLRPFGKQARLLAPMYTTQAARYLKRTGAMADILVLDARFNREGFLEDLRSYFPLLRSGARIMGRWGGDIVAELYAQGSYAGRNLRRMRLGSFLDGASWCVDLV